MSPLVNSEDHVRTCSYNIRKNAFAYTFEPKYVIIFSQFLRFLDDKHTNCEWKSNSNVSNSNINFGRGN